MACVNYQVLEGDHEFDRNYENYGLPSKLVAPTVLRAGRSGVQIPVGTRFSAPVQTDPGAHPVSCTMGTESFSRC